MPLILNMPERFYCAGCRWTIVPMTALDDYPIVQPEGYQPEGYIRVCRVIQGKAGWSYHENEHGNPCGPLRQRSI